MYTYTRGKQETGGCCSVVPVRIDGGLDQSGGSELGKRIWINSEGRADGIYLQNGSSM